MQLFLLNVMPCLKPLYATRERRDRRIDILPIPFRKMTHRTPSERNK